MKMLTFRTILNNPIQKTGNLIVKRKFADIVPSKEIKTDIAPQETLLEIAQKNSGLTSEEYNSAKKTGADLFLTNKKFVEINSAGFYFEEINENINLAENSRKGWKLQYLKNMLLLQDYNTVFREFLQSCARCDPAGLNLTTEKRFYKYVFNHLNTFNKYGYDLEIDSLKILQEFKVLRIEIYKNLKIDRELNKDYKSYNFIKIPTPLAPLVVAHEKGNDHSIFKDPKPFILATTMYVRTPMKIAMFNQNMTKKIKGLPEEEIIEYCVRFESEFNYSDFAWILPTQNKPKRLRSTKITDINNVMRGNPLFIEKFDLINDELRYRYMNKSKKLDDYIKGFVHDSKLF